ncbi:MAG: class I SAM-dependent methyltransferase [Magnetococcus sp. MYC-9]
MLTEGDIRIIRVFEVVTKLLHAGASVHGVEAGFKSVGHLTNGQHCLSCVEFIRARLINGYTTEQILEHVVYQLKISRQVANFIVGLVERLLLPVDSPLFDFIRNHEHRYIYKPFHFLEIYERHLAGFRNKEVSLMEFGVFHGGSLQMWKHYLGEHAKIYGVDIDPRCTVASEERIRVITADQGDVRALRVIKRFLPTFDIIVDDGGHYMHQQINTFEEMFPHLNDGGIYLIEDIGTSYWKSCGGGYRNPGSFIEYSKHLVDQIHARHSDELSADKYTDSIFAMHYYDGVLVIEKRSVAPPIEMKFGSLSF